MLIFTQSWVVAATAVAVIGLATTLALIGLDFEGTRFVGWARRNIAALGFGVGWGAATIVALVSVGTFAASSLMMATAFAVVILASCLAVVVATYLPGNLVPWLPTARVRAATHLPAPSPAPVARSSRSTGAVRVPAAPTVALEALRLGVGLVWMLNLLFIVVPASGYWGSFSTVAASYGGSTPGGAGIASFVSSHPLVFAWLIAIVTAYLAIAFLLGVTTRLACAVGFAASAVFLWTQWGQTFAFPGGTDVGPHPLYLAIYLTLFVAGAGRFWSVDGWIWRTGRARLAPVARWIATRPPAAVA